MKTLYRFQLKSYFGPFIATLCIAIFVLLMQFLFVYMDEMIGKGLGVLVLSQFIGYVVLTIVPTALPLAILLSSLMTFGNLAENYELAAMKSAGLSLRKIMLPLTIVSILTSGAAFYFANNVLPWANLKMKSMRYDIQQSKPTIAFKEGAFYNGVKGYSIRINKKEADGKTMRDIMIYDHTEGLGNNKVIFADTAIMEMSAGKDALIIKLKNGHSYEEMINTDENLRRRPLIRSKFKEEVLQIDISDFKMNKTDESLFKQDYQMMDIVQLRDVLDSVTFQVDNRCVEIQKTINTNYYSRSLQYMSKADSTKKNHLTTIDFLNDLSKTQKVNTLETAMNIARSAKSLLENYVKSNHDELLSLHSYQVEMHRKFTLSLACFILFFIGAPLGAIIRKGGLGMPAVISVIFFLLFYIISITGEKFAKEGVIPVPVGMWMATGILLPIGIFLTYKASIDSSLFDTDSYLRSVKKLFRIKDKTA